MRPTYRTPMSAITPGGAWARRRVTQRELETIALSHAKYLARKPGGIRAILSLADLSGLEITRRILAEAEMSGANLTGSVLNQSVFDGAILYSANLRQSKARFARFIGADLRGASLRGAEFTGSNFEGADLRSAAMMRVTAPGHYSRVIPAEDAGFVGVDFSDCCLVGARMGGVNLVGPNFSNAMLQGVNFDQARIENACLDGAVLTGVAAVDLPFSPAELKKCLPDPSPQAIAEAGRLRTVLAEHESWASSDGKRGAPGVIDGQDIRPLRDALQRRQLTGLSARKVIGVGADFSGSQLQCVNFHGADLRGADFSNADLRGAEFEGANLMHAKFDGAELGRLMLTGGGHRDTSFDGAKLAENQLSRATRANDRVVTRPQDRG